MTFEVNGYHLSDLVTDPAAVERSLADLVKALADARAHMTQLGRDDLADRLDDLCRQLQASGNTIDDAFDRAFNEVASAAADACTDAAGPGGLRSPDDRNAQIHQALSWSLIDMAVVRVGGRGTFLRPGGGPSQGR